MGRTSIEWTAGPDGSPGETWNPVRGCSRVSEGCRNCYAERVAARFSKPPVLAPSGVSIVAAGPFDGFARMDRDGPHWTGRVELVPDKLEEPLRWRRPRRIFVNSMSDLFHESLPDEAIDRVFAVMACAPQHTFLVLTKRAERMRGYLAGRSKSIKFWEAAAREVGHTLQFENPKTRLMLGLVAFPLRNVWLGVSVEHQKTADERIPLLLNTPAALRFVSYEPALGPVDFTAVDNGWVELDALKPGHPSDSRLDWIIVGGESGPGARPFDVAWARSTIEQCKAAGVACFVKQLGAATAVSGAEANPRHPTFKALEFGLKSRKGGDPSEWPADLRVRDFPSSNRLARSA